MNERMLLNSYFIVVHSKSESSCIDLVFNELLFNILIFKKFKEKELMIG